jgi:hypothetical protein
VVLVESKPGLGRTRLLRAFLLKLLRGCLTLRANRTPAAHRSAWREFSMRAASEALAHGALGRRACWRAS